MKDCSVEEKAADISHASGLISKITASCGQTVADRNGIPVEVTREGQVEPMTMQGDRDELSFLIDLAERSNFEMYIRVDPKTGEDKLFFVKPTDNRDARRSRVFV